MATSAKFPSPEALSVSKDPTSVLDQIVAENKASMAARNMPTLTVKQFSEREKELEQLKSLLKEGIDYGTIPGTPKPALYKPGAEKICAFFGYAPTFTETCIEDWTGAHYGEPLFYYKYTCTLERDGKPVGAGVGSANSWESKYRYRWLKESDIPMSYTKAQIDDMLQRDGGIFEFEFAIEKRETSGKYGKPAEYWAKFDAAIRAGQATKTSKQTKAGKTLWGWEIMDVLYRVPNPDFADVINTCQKMGQKRSHIAATLSATGASQYFTQDPELIPGGRDEDEVNGEATATQSEVAERRIAEEKARAEAQRAPGNAAAANSAQSKPAPAPAAPQPVYDPLEGVPEEMHAVISNLEKPGGAATGTKMLRDSLIERFPQTGASLWTKIVLKHGLKPGGRNTTTAIRAALLDAFHELHASDPVHHPALAPESQETFAAADSDLPGELFENAKEVSYAD